MRDVAFWSEYNQMLTPRPVTETTGHRRAICGGCYEGRNINQVSGGKGPLGTRVFGVREVKGE